MVHPTLLPQLDRLLVVTGLTLSFLVGRSSQAGGDCMSGNEIDCFECNSWDDPRCHDPWNWTYPKSTMPPTKPCEGCCVKMVQFIGTEHYSITRTCTDNLEINFFMVNHGCMTEGHRHGHMCFCEEDECNTGSRVSAQHYLLSLLLLSILVYILRWYWGFTFTIIFTGLPVLSPLTIIQHFSILQ